MSVSNDARLQITAGTALLDQSRLIEWSAATHCFRAVSDDAFEYSARRAHPAFGRLMYWLVFSAGAEYLAKGLCLSHGIRIGNGEPKQIPEFPRGSISEWLKSTKGRPPRTVPSKSYGTIGDLTWNDRQTKTPAPLEKLARVTRATDGQLYMPLGTYNLLGSAIRNRDAHAYIPSVRASHFWLVADLFMPTFNFLVDSIPDGGGKKLTEWLKEPEP